MGPLALATHVPVRSVEAGVLAESVCGGSGVGGSRFTGAIAAFAVAQIRSNEDSQPANIFIHILHGERRASFSMAASCSLVQGSLLSAGGVAVGGLRLIY